MGNWVWDGVVGCMGSGDVDTSYVDIVSTSVEDRGSYCCYEGICTRMQKIMAAKGGPLAARSPYQPPNKRSSSIEARPQAKHPQGSSSPSKIRYQKTSTLCN
jgi:hypothetical protein